MLLVNCVHGGDLQRKKCIYSYMCEPPTQTNTWSLQFPHKISSSYSTRTKRKYSLFLWCVSGAAIWNIFYASHRIPHLRSFIANARRLHRRLNAIIILYTAFIAYIYKIHPTALTERFFPKPTGLWISISMSSHFSQTHQYSEFICVWVLGIYLFIYIHVCIWSYVKKEYRI